MKWHSNAKNIVYLVIILFLVLVMIYSGLQILESTVLFNGQEDAAAPSKTIVRGDVEYFPRQDITVLMVLGIDQFGPVESSGSYNNKGSADMVSLVIFDERDQSCSVLCINRDTMVKMPVLGVGGKEAGTVVQQLALAHTYGSGLEDSCENVKKTVSDFLYGINIDYYVSMNMDAISVINDAVGGVTVTVTDDFSEVDPTITMGQLTLNGKQAINYVRTRKNVSDQTNLSRIERQKQYMEGFLSALRSKQDSNVGFLADAYEDVSDYIVTDCSVKVLSGLMSRYEDYEIRQMHSIEGENVLSGTYFEFHADEQALDALILQLFYAPK